ncbi:hypothetical protein LTR97_012218 [Elasticomyces elasticus]|uniref:Uncharacterized protein n=1 Tax=Elasticomyces elasticus TaxID=574655 RepID=A0AAN7VX13_9PEZI|nr:hypothetical protein LTR97_012218 [Elasticomyces elasticus]
MADEVAEYREEHAKASEMVATLEDHASALIRLAHDVAGRARMILDSLNATHEVKRFSVHDFGTLKAEDLIVEYVAATKETEKTIILVKLYEAMVVEIAVPLDYLRSRAATLSELARRLAQDAATTVPDVPDERAVEESLHDDVVRETYAELEIVKDRVVDAYRVLLKEWAEVIAEIEVSIQALDKAYDGKLRSGALYANVDLGLGYLRDHIAVVLGNIKSKDPLRTDREYYREAWEKARMTEGVQIARIVASDHSDLKVGYEAAFITAVKLAPSTFAYSGWCKAA